MHMTVMDHAATSRTRAKQIQSVTHHSVSAHTIRRRLQQSGMSVWHSLLRLLTNSAFACNITIVLFEFVDTVGRSYCTVALCIATMILKSIMVWGGKKTTIENV
ncbi:hypothetical protein TNCV_3726341 [Trichonephila clavipes]|nr:hypothetical protein TNCV_3726341 [Trichonephila clavipes]